MMSTDQIIAFITYIISVYIGYFIIIAGLIGNIINILVFTQLKLFRKNQSAFYLTIGSIVDCCQLIFTTSTRVTTNTFGFDLTQMSLAWCKIRIYFAQFGSITSTGTVCFAAFDQYLATSNRHQLRQMSTFKLAQYLIGSLFIFTTLYSILFPVFHEIRQNSGCIAFNAIFIYYYSFVHLCIFLGIIPIIISSLFSLFAYRNVRHIIRRQIPIVRRRLDRQLTAMILIRVALFVITTLPFITYRIYQVNYPINQNNSHLIVVDQLIRIIVTTIYSINYIGTFYVFLISSNRYCRQVKYLFVKKIWRKCLLKKKKTNQITPENQLRTVESHVSSMEID